MEIACRNRTESAKVYITIEEQRGQSEEYLRTVREEKDGWLY